MRRRFAIIASLVLATFVAACTTLQMRDPPQVMVAGIEPLQGEGMELRLLVKLRVQNPNDVAIDYNGVALEMDVLGSTFATGVSDQSGTIPRFGEAVIEVPVTASAFRMARQAIGMMSGRQIEKIDYAMKGKLNGSLFNSVRFKTTGSFDLPVSKSTAGS